MAGNATLTDLYLGAEPVGVTTEGDRILLHLSDNRLIALPLEIVSQLDTPALWTPESRILLLSRAPRIESAEVTEDSLVVRLVDGRILHSPLRWFPRLLYASHSERNRLEILGDDDVLHWPLLDEDIELTRLFVGGESLENEQSVQGWLADRRNEALVLNESIKEYRTEEER